MQFLKTVLRLLSVIVLAALITIAVSTLAERGRGETIVHFFGMRITVTGFGAAVSFLICALFAGLWKAKQKGGANESADSGWLNAIGFGVLPGIAVWKIFEQYTTLSRGQTVIRPLPLIPFLTAEEAFCPSQIELLCAAAVFAGMVIWLMTIKKQPAGNGDLLQTIVCIWGMVRSTTELFRKEPLITIGKVNVAQILFMLAADVCLIFWTVRTDRMKKSTAAAVLEWVTVISCQSIIILNRLGIIAPGSGIGDLALTAGCAALCLILMLLSGKDSRDDRAAMAAGSDNSVYGS